MLVAVIFAFSLFPQPQPTPQSPGAAAAQRLAESHQPGWQAQHEREIREAQQQARKAGK